MKNRNCRSRDIRRQLNRIGFDLEMTTHYTGSGYIRSVWTISVGIGGTTFSAYCPNLNSVERVIKGLVEAIGQGEITMAHLADRQLSKVPIDELERDG